jgi:hypothetical protein
MAVRERMRAAHGAEMARRLLYILSLVAFAAALVVVSALLGSALGSGS